MFERIAPTTSQDFSSTPSSPEFKAFPDPEFAAKQCRISSDTYLPKNSTLSPEKASHPLRQFQQRLLTAEPLFETARSTRAVEDLNAVQEFYEQRLPAERQEYARVFDWMRAVLEKGEGVDWLQGQSPDQLVEMVEELRVIENSKRDLPPADEGAQREWLLGAVETYARWGIRVPLREAVEKFRAEAMPDSESERAWVSLELAGYLQVGGCVAEANEVYASVLENSSRLPVEEQAWLQPYCSGILAMNDGVPEVAQDFFQDLTRQEAVQEWQVSLAEEAGAYLHRIAQQQRLSRTEEMVTVFEGLVRIVAAEHEAQGRGELAGRMNQAMDRFLENAASRLGRDSDFSQWDKEFQTAELQKFLKDSTTGNLFYSYGMQVELLDADAAAWGQHWEHLGKRLLVQGKYSEAMFVGQWLEKNGGEAAGKNLQQEVEEAQESEENRNLLKAVALGVTLPVVGVGVWVYFGDSSLSTKNFLIESASFGVGMGTGAVAERWLLQAGKRWIKRPWLLKTAGFYAGRNLEAATYSATRQFLNRASDGTMGEWSWWKLGKDYAAAAVTFRLSYLFRKGMAAARVKNQESLALAEKSVRQSLAHPMIGRVANRQLRRARFLNRALNYRATDFLGHAHVLALAQSTRRWLGLDDSVQRGSGYGAWLRSGMTGYFQMRPGVRTLEGKHWSALERSLGRKRQSPFP